MNQIQLLLISTVLVVLGTAKPLVQPFVGDFDSDRSLKRLLLVDLRDIVNNEPEVEVTPLNVDDSAVERIQKRRLVMGMPNILHMGNKRMAKRMLRGAQLVHDLAMNKRRISMHMPNLVYMRPQK
ncbi:unnamed protein product [Bursaphelenchus okinawaensis]|uniref:Uncharacterized protein n=1 Tax=Bursaphelenchus okinawaensis TaxID=465554 RepID=A0A811LLJ4_9BILA|nr:unnamed protein product [Bursaphelenchus okinawaensis]CAG9124654.1 unnamed protein product [Bursaphelenchus okinawaensis]